MTAILLSDLVLVGPERDDGEGLILPNEYLPAAEFYRAGATVCRLVERSCGAVSGA